MSSLVDAVLTSDNLPAHNSSDGATPKSRQDRSRRRSSARPMGPPSESAAGPLSDADGFADDEVVGVRGNLKNKSRNPMDRDVPRVVDAVGETVRRNFVDFLAT